MYNIFVSKSPKQPMHDQVNRPGPEDKIFFYPKEFYVFDNFSSFSVEYNGYVWPTSEHAYQAAKFKGYSDKVIKEIKKSRSAHDAQKIADKHKKLRNPKWCEIKKDIMKDILRCKVEQHPYVLKKLIASKDREIIEDSWRDEIWGWGPYKDGQNLLGNLWMEIRDEFTENS